MTAAGTGKDIHSRSGVARTQRCCASGSVGAPSREQWLRTYTRHVLNVWLGQRTPLGLAPTYAQWIREDLAAFYEQPLMRAFIEQTY